MLKKIEILELKEIMNKIDSQSLSPQEKILFNNYYKYFTSFRFKTSLFFSRFFLPKENQEELKSLYALLVSYKDKL